MKQSGDIFFRSCTEDDIPAVLDLWAASGSVPGSTDTEEAMRVRLRRDADLFVLAFDGNTLAGTLMGAWDGWRANMYRLSVHPAYRRRGIALRLVRIVEERLRAMGAVRAYALAITPELAPGAVEFWKSAGYELNPRTLPYVKTL